MQTRRTSTVARFFTVGEAEALERIARTVKRVVMNFILIGYDISLSLDG